MVDNKLFYHKDLIYTIYQEQSFSKAAKKLFISQPSLSVIVKKIEDEIGQPLFDRSCKPIRLTEVGEAYIKAAADIQNTEENFLEYIGALNKLDAGSLRIGSNQLLSSFVLPKYIAEFIKVYPNIKLSLLDGSSPILENAITLGDVDIIIDNQELDEEFFVNKEISKENLLLAVPAAFKCNKGLEMFKLEYNDILEGRDKYINAEPVPLKYFEDVPFNLMTKDNDTRTRTDAMFRDADVNPRVILEIDRLITQYNFLLTYTAASIVSDTLIRHVSGMAKEEERNIAFYKLPSQFAERKIVMSYKKIKHYSKAMDAFARLIKDLK